MHKKNIIPTLLKSLIVSKLLFILIGMAACSDTDESMKVDKDNQFVTFTVSTPYSTPKSYAMSDVSENAVRSVDVLAFRVEGGEELYTYRSSGVEIKDGADNTKKEFTVTLRKDDELSYRFVILANVAEELDALSTTQVATKKLLLGRLLSQNNDKWNSASATDYRAIPMWGETKNTMKITDNVKKITDVTLLRSLVSIELIVGASAQNDFKLSEVYLYNRKTRGRVVPIMSHFNQAEMKVTEASMPVDNPADPLTIWDGLQYNSSSETELLKTIYTYEAPSVSNDKDLDATCIVVGGKYKNNQTYYRLDFVERNSTGDFLAYMDLLRNHRYTFTITNVTDNGYDSPDEAFFGKKMGMTADVQEWNMSDMSEVVVDENYFLKVSTGLFDIISQEAYYGLVTVHTDHPKGWKAETGESWIEITSHATSFFKFTLHPISSGSREGRISIKVGNLTKEIKVRQSAS